MWQQQISAANTVSVRQNPCDNNRLLQQIQTVSMRQNLVQQIQTVSVRQIPCDNNRLLQQIQFQWDRIHVTTTDWLSFQKDWSISSLLLLIQRRTTINALPYPVIVILQATHPCVVYSCWMSFHAWVKTWASLWLFTLCCAHLAVFSFVAKMLINK